MRAHKLGLSFMISVPLLVPHVACPQQKPAAAPESSVNPEMDRLAKAFAGDWNTEEHMEPTKFFPNGGDRHGQSHVRLIAGGTTLINEVQSDGSAGKLDGMVVIWWDKEAQLYRFFTCFKSSGNACGLRGTAHWEGDTFVNDFEETVDGKPLKVRDRFFDITPSSRTLTMAIDNGDGTMQILVTTRSTRR